MRGRRRDEPDLWGDLYDRFRGPTDPVRRPRGSGLPPETSGRLIDAAIGILGAIRTFVDVAEDALEERRARLDEAPRPADRWVRAPERATRPDDGPEEGGVVRDIPLAGS
jgi:hypothetical protein